MEVFVMSPRATLCITLVSAVALSLTVGCERKQAAIQSPPRPPAQVTVVVATLAPSIPVYLDAIGRAVPTETVSIVPQVGGKVLSAAVKNGAVVNKGDLLFEIDPRPYQAALASAQASLQQANVDHDFAVQEYERINNLTDKNAVSKQEFAQRKNAIAVAEARIASANATIEAAKLNVEYATIRSPIAGRAGVRMVDAGNVVTNNSAPMIVIDRMDPILAEFTITENDLGTVRKYLSERGMALNNVEQGLKVMVDVPGNSPRVLSALASLPATTSSTSRSTTAREGRLVFLDNSVQANAGTVKLRAELPNSDGYFWPGQFVNVRLVLAEKTNAVLIPTQAQQIGQQGPYVYVVDEQSIAQLRPIVPGQRQEGGMLAIDKGIAPGERIILTGQNMVMPQAKVQVANPTTAPAASPTIRPSQTK